MNDEILRKIRENKEKCVDLYDFEKAAEWRDIEKYFFKVISREITLDQFINFSKDRKDRELYFILYEMISKLQRKDKISKIEKLYNNK